MQKVKIGFAVFGRVRLLRRGSVFDYFLLYLRKNGDDGHFQIEGFSDCGADAQFFAYGRAVVHIATCGKQTYRRVGVALRCQIVRAMRLASGTDRCGAIVGGMGRTDNRVAPADGASNECAGQQRTRRIAYRRKHHHSPICAALNRCRLYEVFPAGAYHDVLRQQRAHRETVVRQRNRSRIGGEYVETRRVVLYPFCRRQIGRYSGQCQQNGRAYQHCRIAETTPRVA